MRAVRLVPALALCLAVAGCAAAPDATSPAATSHGDDALGGDGEQVAAAGVFPATPTVPLRGTLEQDGRGCWLLAIAGTSRLVAMPAGSAPTADRTGWELADGTTVHDGQPVDVVGAVVHATMVPDVPDGYWGSVLATCAPDVEEFVVVTSIGPAFDPAALTDQEWADAVSTATPTVAHGCGHGFAATTTDRRIAVQLTPLERPTDRAPVTLPDSGWIATVTVGKDLLVDNCDDVVEPWEAVPVQHRTWTIVSGRLTIDGSGDLPSCDGGVVTATLAGASVEASSEMVPLADVDLVNDAYGCFAG